MPAPQSGSSVNIKIFSPGLKSGYNSVLLTILLLLTISISSAGDPSNFTLYYEPELIHQGDDITLYGTAPVEDGTILEFNIYSNNNSKPVYYAAKEVNSGRFCFSIDTEDISDGNYSIRMFYEGIIKASADIVLNQENKVEVSLLPKNGALKIYSTPGGASAYIDGNFVGMTETNKGIRVDGIAPGDHIISLSKPGYINKSQIATVFSDMLNEVTFYLGKLPTNGTLSICSYPTDAKIYLDDKLIGETDDIFKNMDPGKYHLRLWKEVDGTDPNASSFEDKIYTYEEEIEITAGETTSVFAHMEEMRQPSVLEVKTIPNLAEVYIDGTYMGESNIILNPIAEGDHTISIFKPGYAEYSGTINIPADGLSFKMTLTHIYDIGELLIVKSNPPELPVFIDGYYRGKTPESITGLEVGEHEVCIKSGDNKWEGTVETAYSGSVTVLADFSNEDMTGSKSSPGEDNEEEKEEEFSEEELLKMYGSRQTDTGEEPAKENNAGTGNENRTIIEDIIGFVTEIIPF